MTARLRRADPRTWDLHDAFFAVVLAAVLVAPAAAFVQAAADGWAPYGDDATIAIRTLDVFAGDPPITGMRSTSGDSGHPDLASHHLGPLEFYLLAIPVALAGGAPLGIVLGTVLVAGTASVLSVVWARRLGGELGMVVFGTGLLVSQWAIGPESMYRPLNPYPALLPIYLLLLLSWAVLRGDHRALPPFAVAAALALQANLAFVPLMVTVVLLVTVAAVVRERGTGRRRPTPKARRSYRWAGALGLAAWLPSLVEVFAHQPNNIAQVARWATSGTGNPIGLPAALEHLSLLAPAPGGFRPVSEDLLTTGGAVAMWIGGAVLLLVAAVATGWMVPHGRASSAWPARVALVANLAMLATASRLPEWPAAPYWIVQWLPVVAFTWAALVWRACAYLPDVSPTLGARRVLPVGATVVAAALALALVSPSPDPAEGQAYTAASREAVQALGPGEGRPLRIEGLGFIPTLALGPGLAYETRRTGWRPHYMSSWPFPEDADHLWQETAGEDAVHVVVVDSAEPEHAIYVPQEAEEIGHVEIPHREGALTIYRVPGG